MKKTIWIIVIVIIILSIGAVSGAMAGIAVNKFVDEYNQEVVYPDVDEATYSMLDKIGIGSEQLSGFSTLQEALLNIEGEVEISNIKFTSEEITAILNVSPEYLKSMFVKSVVFDIQSDNTVNLEVYLDAEEINRNSDVPDIAIGIIQSTKFTINISITGVSEKGELIVVVNDIYVKDVHIMNFMNIFPVGSEFKGYVSEIMDKEIKVLLPMLKDLKSFEISDGYVYIDAIFTYGGN